MSNVTVSVPVPQEIMFPVIAVKVTRFRYFHAIETTSFKVTNNLLTSDEHSSGSELVSAFFASTLRDIVFETGKFRIV
jgi:hypothetical protein